MSDHVKRQNLSGNELLETFVAQYKSGAQGCRMEHDTAQALAIEIERLQNARHRVLEELDLMLSEDPMVRQNTAAVIRANLE